MNLKPYGHPERSSLIDGPRAPITLMETNRSVQRRDVIGGVSSESNLRRPDQWKRISRWLKPALEQVNPRKKAGMSASSQAKWHRRYAAASHLPVPVYEAIKRLIDILLVTLSLPLAVPLLALAVLLIKLDSPGPAFYRQQRTGKGGKRFDLYKLRTMVPDADKLKQKLAHLNNLSYPDFKIENDPRITRVGRILRKTSLDELPQLINVLKGEMSLVGPRPTSFRADSYQLWQTARLAVTPGLTGLWQISGRAEVDFDQRLRLDIFYIQNRCLMLDIEILFRTVFAVLTGRGAS